MFKFGLIAAAVSFFTGFVYSSQSPYNFGSMGFGQTGFGAGAGASSASYYRRSYSSSTSNQGGLSPAGYY